MQFQDFSSSIDRGAMIHSDVMTFMAVMKTQPHETGAMRDPFEPDCDVSFDTNHSEQCDGKRYFSTKTDRPKGLLCDKVMQRTEQLDASSDDVLSMSVRDCRPGKSGMTTEQLRSSGLVDEFHKNRQVF